MAGRGAVLGNVTAADVVPAAMLGEYRKCKKQNCDQKTGLRSHIASEFSYCI